MTAKQIARLLEWTKAVTDRIYDATGVSLDYEWLALREALLPTTDNRKPKHAPRKEKK